MSDRPDIMSAHSRVARRTEGIGFDTVPRSPRGHEIVLLAVAAALITALLHVVIVTMRLYVLEHFTRTPRQFIWLAPLAYTLHFLIIGAVVWALARIKPRGIEFGTIVGIFVALSVFSLLLMYRRIHPVAYAVIAGGIAVHVARRAARDPEKYRRLAVSSAGISAAALIVWATVQQIVPLSREWRAVTIARTAPPDAPNILLLILDTVRASNLSAYGYHRATTPNLSALANEGTLFEYAFSPSAWTLPSHASMLTGVWARETGTSYEAPMPRTLPTLPAVLRARGYITAGFVANAGWAGHETGLQRGFIRYETHALDVTQLLWIPSLAHIGLEREIVSGIIRRSPARVARALARPDFTITDPPAPRKHRADEIVTNFLAWRTQVVDRHPYFAMLNLFDAHDPYDPPVPFDTRFNGGRRAIDRYDGAIAFMDSVIGALITDLHARGELDRTVLIVTSDHGELFGEHHLTGHGNSVYLPVMHVPLIVRFPTRVPSGARRSEVVSLRDIAATILDLVEAPGHLPNAAPSAARLPGHSLFARADPSPRPEPILLHASRAIRNPNIPTARGDIFGLLDAEWHYARYGDGEEELFAWLRDPAEEKNLVPDASAATVLRRFRALAARLVTP